MMWNDGATDAHTMTGLSTEEMGVHKPCQLKQNVHKGRNFRCNEAVSSNKLKGSQLITHAARDQGGDGLCPGSLSRMTWKGNAALRESAWILLYKAVCTVNITVSWVWELFTPLKGRDGEGNLNVCQIEITVKELGGLINSFLSA